jgi:hypothetical protein
MLRLKVASLESPAREAVTLKPPRLPLAFLQKTAGVRIGAQQCFDPGAQLGPALTSLFQIVGLFLENGCRKERAMTTPQAELRDVFCEAMERKTLP